MVNGYTDNVPIGPELMRQGVTSNLIRSQKRAEKVAQYMISQGVNPSRLPISPRGRQRPLSEHLKKRGGGSSQVLQHFSGMLLAKPECLDAFLVLRSARKMPATRASKGHRLGTA